MDQGTPGRLGGVGRVLLTQALLTFTAALAFWIAQGWFAAVSALYGGAITLLAAGWLGRRIQRAAELARHDPRRGELSLYVGTVQRFVVVLALLGLGFGALKLAPIPLIVAFAASQFGFLARPGGA